MYIARVVKYDPGKLNEPHCFWERIGKSFPTLLKKAHEFAERHYNDHSRRMTSFIEPDKSKETPDTLVDHEIYNGWATVFICSDTTFSAKPIWFINISIEPIEEVK